MRGLFLLALLIATIATPSGATATRVQPLPTPWVPDRVDAPGVQRIVFASRVAKTDVGFHVLLPPEYDTEPTRRYPVVYWLHGSGGGGAGIRPISALFTRAMRDQHLPPVIVVFVNGLPNGMYCDWKDGSVRVESVVIREVVPEVDRQLRTQRRREGRILDGFSMGGYGAARLGFKYSDRFRAVSMLGAGPLQPSFEESPRAGPRQRDAIFQRVYGNDPAFFREQSPWRLAEVHPRRIADRLVVRLAIGDRDATYANNARFHQHLEQLGIPHQYRVLPGIAHDPLALIQAMRDDFWRFYRTALESDTP